jgi:quinol monooxygenase YgiN
MELCYHKRSNPKNQDMKKLMLKYKIKADKMAHFHDVAKSFVDAILTNEPGIAEYNVLQGPDSTSFVHFMAFKDDEAEAIHRRAKYTRKFMKEMHQCIANRPSYVLLDATGQAIAKSENMETAECADICIYEEPRTLAERIEYPVPKKNPLKDLRDGDIVLYTGGTFLSASGHLYFLVSNKDHFGGDPFQATLYHISELGRDGWTLGLPKEHLKVVGHSTSLLSQEESPDMNYFTQRYLKRLIDTKHMTEEATPPTT